MAKLQSARRWRAIVTVTVLLLSSRIYTASASDHLDTPTVTADPAADIGDLFAWTTPDDRRLNLVMTIVGRRFSDRLQYVFHVGSGQRLGSTTSSTMIVCRFDEAGLVECWVGDVDYARGDASGDAGLTGQRGKCRVFAGLRDDPFFNNVKGSRAAFAAAAKALEEGVPVDASGYSGLPDTTSQRVLDLWRHTDGGPGTNFLAGWKSSALVVSVDLDVVSAGGPLLAVWAAVHKP